MTFPETGRQGKDLQGYGHQLDILLSKSAQLYAFHRDPSHLYAGITAEASFLVNAERCSLMLPGDTREVLRVSAVQGTDKNLIGGMKMKVGHGIAGKVYAKGEPILIDSEEQIRGYECLPRDRYKTKSALSLPLKLEDEVIGVLNLTDKSNGESFTEKDLETLSLFAFQAALILKLSHCYRLSEEMRELSVTDFLTGLFNRRYFNIRIEEELQRVKRSGEGFALAILDIDNFKLFNDTEGHLAGDTMLKCISAVLKRTTRAQDILVRYGGEEFAVIMPKTSRDDAFHAAERMREAVRTMILPEWKKYPKKLVTISAGVVTCCSAAGTVEEYIENADKALYMAKIQGKDCTVVYDDTKDDLEFR